MLLMVKNLSTWVRGADRLLRTCMNMFRLVGLNLLQLSCIWHVSVMVNTTISGLHLLSCICLSSRLIQYFINIFFLGPKAIRSIALEEQCSSLTKRKKRAFGRSQSTYCSYYLFLVVSFTHSLTRNNRQINQVIHKNYIH